MATLDREARETAAGARRQIAEHGAAFAALGARLRAQPPTFVATCARGSSDHAATYGKYLVETRARRVVASIGPGIVSTYGRIPDGVAGALVLAISQSGRSPDLLALASAARDAGALVVALVNDESSPLAAIGEIAIPLCAGPELAVAATKSHLLAALALLQLVAAWTGEPALAEAVARAPDLLDAVAAADWLAPLAPARSCYVVARGLGLGAAAEIALKLKETCGLHAEAFSTAEVLHGPVALVERGFPVVALEQADATAAGVRDVVAHLATLGAMIIAPPTATIPAELAPLAHTLAAYLALPALARARGHDADRPPAHLRKVTETR